MITKIKTTNEYLKLPINLIIKQSKGKKNYSGIASFTFSNNNDQARLAYYVNLETLKLRLMYSYNNDYEEKINLDYIINLTKTNCNYGGYRYWYICPLIINEKPCERRVGIIYAGKYFGCRHCYKLKYESQSNSNYRKNGLYYSFFKLREIDEIGEKINKLKRWGYKGKPNKKYQKLLNKIDTNSKVIVNNAIKIRD
ncbi:MAG: hypothetical protein WCO35_02430 [Candidatus Nomurabacteria bacterium]